MEYFSILNLAREPFSNSPDPEYFFQSSQHIGCLQKLELSLRLRRGLNVVLGDVGTGKTTLCRQLIRRFAQDEDYETHLVLDPQFGNPLEFLTTVVEMFTGKRVLAKATNEWQVKEAIKKYIFRRGVDEKKTVVLIIDEGQKLPEFCLEILREFLNYETNEYKLLQIAIFAQKEFQKTLEAYANFADRINLYHILGPMNFRDTRNMIQFRLKQSSEKSKAPRLFSYPALWAIYKNTGGYPRKIINLCHQCVLAMIIQNKTKAGWFLVRSCVKRVSTVPVITRRRIAVAAIIGIAIVLLAVGLAPESYKQLIVWKPIEIKSAAVPVMPSRSDGQDIQETSPPTNMPAAEARSSDESVPETKKSIDSDTSVHDIDKTLVKTTAEAAVKVPEIESRLPTVLGHLSLRRSDTLWRLIEKIYGNFENQYLEA